MVPFFEVSKIHKKDMTMKMENVFYYENSELHDFLEKNGQIKLKNPIVSFFKGF